MPPGEKCFVEAAVGPYHRLISRHCDRLVALRDGWSSCRQCRAEEKQTFARSYSYLYLFKRNCCEK